MSAHLRRLAILFSVTLNVAFLGTYLAHAVPRWLSKDVQQGERLPYQMLQLTEAQHQTLDRTRHTFHARLQEVGAAITAEQLRLIDALAQPEADLTAVRAAQEKIQGLQRAMQDTVIDHLLAEKAVFAGEQRTHFFRLIRERIAHGDQGTPPWMRPGDTTPAGAPAR